jgi:hypothetical protein
MQLTANLFADALTQIIKLLQYLGLVGLTAQNQGRKKSLNSCALA